jgi:galactonate dehydratase
MRIEAVRTYARQFAGRPQLLVKVVTESGHHGWGEAGLTGQEPAVGATLRLLTERLKGARIHDTADILIRANQAWYFEGGRTLMAAVSAIDIALHDLIGKFAGLPVCDLIGGRTRRTVPLFYSLDMDEPDALASRATALVKDGWRALRLTVCAPDDRDGKIYDPQVETARAAAACRVLRDAIGSDVLLGIDLHHRFLPPDVLRFLAATGPSIVDFVEEPIQAHSVAAYRDLRARSSVAFAVGEEFSTRNEIAPYLEAGVIDYCRPDIALVGGIRELQKIAALCEFRYVPILLHHPLGPIAFAANLHFSMATSGVRYVEYQAAKDRDAALDLVFVGRPIVGGGYAVPSENSGLGIEIDELKLELLPESGWVAPELQSQDGLRVPW